MSGPTGRCLCGAVRYAVNGPLRDVIVCHCVECRRWAGGAWPATAARRGDLVVRGATLRWEPSPASASGARRGSCADCGASMFWDAPERETVSVGAGTLDDASGLVVLAHIYVDQAQSWERTDDAPAYPEGYPESAPEPRWR